LITLAKYSGGAHVRTDYLFVSWGSSNVRYEYLYLLRYNVIYPVESQLVFCSKLQPPFSGLKSKRSRKETWRRQQTLCTVAAWFIRSYFTGHLRRWNRRFPPKHLLTLVVLLSVISQNMQLFR
jgi:hypothetical protein